MSISRAEVLALAEATKPGKPNPLFGQTLQKWRKEQNIQPSELARRVGASPQTIHRWEKGYAPRASQLECLRHALYSTPLPSPQNHHPSPNWNSSYTFLAIKAKPP